MRFRNLLYIGGMAALASFVVVLTLHVSALQHDLQSNIDSQVPNRVANVKTWCGAINADRSYARGRAAARRKIDPTVKPYRLGNLNCGKLARKTAASAK